MPIATIASRDAPHVANEPMDLFRAAALTVSDMQRVRVAPTPRAYELWLAYRLGSKPGLKPRLDALIAAGKEITPAIIDMLREEFEFEPGSDAGPLAETVLVMSHSLDDAATELLDHAASGRIAIRDYGELLTRGVRQLGQDATREESLRVISALTADTAFAAERNRELEAQLTATSAKVDRLRKLLIQQRKAASTDQLTGLANRRELDQRLKRTLLRFAAEPCNPVSLLMLDIDHFKRFNDQYGHRAGDLVLRLVGCLLVDSIKGRDLAARYGGEEFAVLLIGADLAAAAALARQFGANLANQRISLSKGPEKGHGRVTISIGVAQLRASDTADTLIERADEALYAAKHAGRNRVTTED